MRKDPTLLDDVQRPRLVSFKKLSKNRVQSLIYADCICGSGKKFKFCCYPKAIKLGVRL